MKSVDRIRVTTAARWLELLGELDGWRDVLADRFMQEIKEGDLYYEGLVKPQELRESSREAFDFLLSELRRHAAAGSAKPPVASDLDFPHRIGVRRARQGVEGQKLTAAIHLDFGLLWSHLLWLAKQSDALTLAVHVQHVWTAVDSFAGRIHSAFMDERVLMAEEKSMSKQSFVALLLSDDPEPPELAARASTTLSIPVDSRLWVAAAPITNDESLRSFAEQLRTQERHAYSHAWGGCTVVFWPAPPPDGTALLGVPEGWRCSADAAALAQVACGIAPLHLGVQGVRHAARVACEIALVLPPKFAGPAAMSDVWSLMASAGLRTRMPQFIDSVLQSVDALSDSERHHLVMTVRAYSRTGDISRTAATLFCHRNTVMKRLRRFKELTGLDMSVPEDAAQALIALADRSL
jgi:hypothetical protein